MASEVISHAIFASSPPALAALPHRLAPRPHPRALTSSLHSSPHSSPRISPCALTSPLCPSPHPDHASRHALHPAVPLRPDHASHSTLHPHPTLYHIPTFTHIPPCAPPTSRPRHVHATPFPSHFFAPQDSLRQVPLLPHHSIFLPSTNFPSASLHPPCPSAKPLYPVLHPASHHALHPAHRPHSSPPISHPRLSIPPCSSAKSRLWIFSCVKRPGSLTT